MKRQLFALCAMLLVVAGPASVRAGENGETEHWYDRVSLGGEIRLRSESQLDYGNLTGGVVNDSFLLLRVRPHIDARPVDGLRIFIQPQFSRAFAQEESTIANNNDAANPNNVFDLHQGFVSWEKIAGSIVTVTVGRQELAYGDERLIGAFNWSNIGRSFDAGKVRLEWEKVFVDGFASWNEKGAGNEYFGGLYSGWKIRPDMTLDTYGLVLNDNDGDGNPAITGVLLGTVGARFAGTALEDRWDYSLEAAVQFGKDKPNTHLAYAGHAATGYTFDTGWKPRLGVEYNFASGDDPGTAKVERFNNLFPTNHDKYGYIDFASWSNLHDIVASTSIKPVKGLMMKLDYHLFLLPEPATAMFRASGAVLRAGAAGASSLAGHEVDFLTKYTLNKWVNFLLGYSVFRGGSFFSDTGTNGTAHFLYGQATASF
ncbi:MAG TPA: alginate export family protein [bacterium]|nr:alginate export family protein [bacterium]